MSCPFSGKGTGPTRRGLLAGAGGALASAGAASLARAAPQVSQGGAELREPFFGPHQGGIATLQQTHTYFAAFDCLAKSRDELATLLQVWTGAAARMSAGDTARDLGQDVSVEGPDGGSALGLSPQRLTITFGFGAGLFSKDGSDRYGLAAKRPAAWSIFRNSTAINSIPREPAATFRFKPAPTIRSSPFTPSESSPACPMALPNFAGFRQAFFRRRQPMKRRGT